MTESTASIFRGALGRLTVGVCLVMSISAFEVLGTATAMPVALEDLGGRTFYGAALAAPLIASVLAVPYAGQLVDQLGARRPMVAGLLLFAAGLILAGAAPVMMVVAAGRFVQGLGGGILFVLQLGVVAKGYPGELKARMLAILSSVWILPGLVGPPIAGFVADQVGWRWVFWGILPVLALTALLVLPPLGRFEPGDTTRDQVGFRFPRWAPLALSGGVAVLIAASSSSLVLLPLGIAGGVVGAVGLHRVLPAGSFSARPGVPAAVATALLASMGYLTAEQYAPLLLHDIRGRSAGESGLPLTVAAICWTAGSWVQARTASNKRRGRAVVGSWLMAAGVGSTLLVLVDSVPFWLTYVTFAVAAAGMGLVFTLDQIVSVEQSEPGQETSTAASIELANLLGTAIGAGVGGIFIAHTVEQPKVGLALAYSMAIVAAIASSFTVRRLPGD